MTNLRVTKQQFINTLFARYKRLYNRHPLEKVVADAKAGAGMQFDVLGTEGFVLVDKKALLKVKKDLEEIVDSDLMVQATKLVGSWVRDRWLGQLSLVLELLEENKP